VVVVERERESSSTQYEEEYWEEWGSRSGGIEKILNPIWTISKIKKSEKSGKN